MTKHLNTASFPISSTSLCTRALYIHTVTINDGMCMNRWYDIGDFQGLDRELCPGLDESAVAVRGLIASEIAAGVRADRIVLGGFSQGAALALWSAFALPNAPPPLGAVACCSGYVPRLNTFSCDASVQHVPVACFHGSADTVVRTTCGQRAVAKLRESGFSDVQWRSYDGMQHEACQDEIDDLVAFIGSKVPPL